VPPDSLPAGEDDTSPDGGVAQHPVHDSDTEDRGPEDYERATDTGRVASVDTVLRRRR
jgi:hypothetical protein